jgi:hypothetical protein
LISRSLLLLLLLCHALFLEIPILSAAAATFSLLKKRWAGVTTGERDTGWMDRWVRDFY